MNKLNTYFSDLELARTGLEIKQQNVNRMGERVQDMLLASEEDSKDFAELPGLLNIIGNILRQMQYCII